MSEYLKTDLTADARAHLLGAISDLYDAHEALQCGQAQLALIEIDRAIVVAKEARKFVLSPTPAKPAAPAPELPPSFL